MIPTNLKYYPFFILIIFGGCLTNTGDFSVRPAVAPIITDSEDGTPTITETVDPEATPTPDDQVRPTDEVFIDPGYCACLNNKPDILNNCANFCNGRSDVQPYLYVNTTLGSSISNNPALGNLFNWCNVQLNQEEANPKCVLEVWDGTNYSDLEIEINEGSNSFKVNISALQQDKTYVATLIEKGSGSNAKGQSFQIRRKNFNIPDYFGPLHITGVSRYTCVTRSGTASTDPISGAQYSYNYAFKIYYYFVDSNNPPTLPAQSFIFCHDPTIFGPIDDASYDRMELERNDFFVWDANDIRFYDQDSDGKLDINNYIEKRLQSDYGNSSKVTIFFEQNWQSYPPEAAASSTSGSSSSSVAPRLGFVMTPWTDPKTGHSFCPTQKDYDSGNAIFRILKDVVGVNTEGLYIGERDPINVKNADGTMVTVKTAKILIREGILKKIWFYYKNGRPTKPDDTIGVGQTFKFFWPPDLNYPYIKKSSQYTFTVKSPDSVPVSGIRPNVTPADKKFACIPAPDNSGD